MKNSSMEVTITELPAVDVIAIKGKNDAFKTTRDSVIITKGVLTQIIVALLKKNMLDYRPIEGILEEINTY